MSSISYIITVYNKVEALPQLIQGLKNQKGNFSREFIFIDDGSTDSSLEKLKSLAHSIDGQVITQHNQGPSVALNAGLKKAKYEWAFLVDGDDYLYPDASNTLLELARQYPDSVICKGKHSNNPKAESYKFDNSIKHIRDALWQALKFYPIGASTSIVRTEIAKKVGGCEERVFIQDYSIALNLSRYGAFTEINKIIATNIEADQQRLSTNKLRENYCTALARLLFLEKNLDISTKHKFYGLQHGLRKALKWHIKNTARKDFKHFIRYFLTRFPFYRIDDQKLLKWLRESLEVYN